MSAQDIYNYRRVDDQIITGGQPTATQLRAAAAEGVAIVINLATLDSPSALEDEAELVRALGMTYHHIPVVWEHPTEADFKAFEQVMNARPSVKTLIHCAANYRVTAFFSLYAMKHLGWSEARADAFRTSIWQGSDYPAWERFVARMKARLAGSDTPSPDSPSG
ncbi:MAG: protein tyrosine phosphatase family protein [Armatimonadota bacterium]|nr:protein tyrosine phosphatase family protein [Armatimonadota bacterium]